MIKAVFFDIDGTLLDHEFHRMPRSTLTALKQLRKQGIKLFVATGRPPNNLTTIKQWFDFDGYLTSNGQYCFNEETVIYEKYIEYDDIKNILPYLNEFQIPVLFATLEENFSNIANYRLDEVASSLNQPRYPVKSADEILDHQIVQLMAYIDEAEDEKFLSYLPNCKSVRWTPVFADIIPIDGGKNRGIDQMIKHYQIDLDEVMAFGDGGNDIDMLQHVGIGIAMGNASDIVKAASDYVTSKIDDDGIYRGLKKFGLIE